MSDSLHPSDVALPSSEEFREQVWGNIADVLARKRRRRMKMRLAGAVCVLFLTVVNVVVNQQAEPTRDIALVPGSSSPTIATLAPPVTIVNTGDLSLPVTMVSTQVDTVYPVHTDANVLEAIPTEKGLVPFLDDALLIAAFDGRPVMLAEDGHGHMYFRFLDDRE